MRTSAHALEAGAVEALVDALMVTGLPAEAKGDDAGPIVVVTGPAGPAYIEVKALSVADGARVRELIRRSGSREQRRSDDRSITVVVADKLMEPARELLRREGWGYLDRRGELRLQGAGLFIHDTTLGSLSRHQRRSDLPIRGAVGIGVALYLLMHPEGPKPSVRQLARAVEASPSSVFEARSVLREHALVDSAGSPLIPELFDVLAEHWQPNRVAVSRKPRPETGWVVSGDVAAAALGAPVVAGAGAVPDFYVPSAALLSRAVRSLGESSHEARAATVAVPPTPLALAKGPGEPRWRGWPVAHPVVAALDLAQDQARGREILSQWEPDSATRVW